MLSGVQVVKKRGRIMVWIRKTVRNGHAKLDNCFFYIFKTKNMFNKKKNAGHHSQERPTLPHTPSARKCHQKHSRKPTKDLPAFIYSLLLKSFRSSALYSSNLQLLYHIDTLVVNHANYFTINTKQTLLWSASHEHLNRYYILSKHQQQNRGKKTIEVQLVNAIRSREHMEVGDKVLPHYQPHIYQIMKRHTIKMKKLRKKLYAQSGLECHRHLKTWTKELPTLISSKEKEQNRDIAAYELHSSPYRNTGHLSESFQLKALTECIKDMFQKQNAFRADLGVSKINQHSWLKERRASEKHFIDCDYSSIEVESRFVLMLESRVRQPDCTEAEETYGLGELKRKYELQRLSQLKEDSQHKTLGHKRNPTEAPYCHREYDIDDPLTPKEHPSRSVFGSTKNLAIRQEKRSKSKKKDNSPYQLTFQKQRKAKQTSKQSTCKQNLKESRNKMKMQSRSKSRSKEKLAFKSRMSKPEIKRL